MKKIILIISILGLIRCSPRNPYYKNHLSDLPYNIFFEAKQEQKDYDIIGESNSKSVLTYLLPDTIHGAFDSGNCVVEVKLNSSNQIADINIIGMTLFGKHTNTITGFDKYHATYKRVNYKVDPKFNEYVEFVQAVVGKLKFTKRNNTKFNTGKAYVKIFFSAIGMQGG